MPAILQQLRTRLDTFPSRLTDSTNKVWIFDDEIKKKNDSFFSSLIIKNPLLPIQYHIQCSHIIHLIHSGVQNTETILQAAETALVLVTLLEQVYSRLDEKNDLEKLRYEQAIFRKILSIRYSQFKLKTAVSTEHQSNTNERIRKLTNHVNSPRKTLNRVWRIFDSITLLDEFVVLREWIEPIELMINPVFIHLNWIFFIPRLAINMILLCKHVIANPWMSKQEYALPWTTRLQVHLMINRRWIELAGDFVWCIGNLISCFFCVGTWIFAEVLLSVGLQLFDFLFTCLHVSIEIHRLTTLENEYKAGCANGSISLDRGYFCALQECIKYEKNVGYLAIFSHALLFISILTILPVITATMSWAPIAGAALSILTTMGHAYAEKKLKQQTHDDIVHLTKHRFFKPLSESPNNEPNAREAKLLQ